MEQELSVLMDFARSQERRGLLQSTVIARGGTIRAFGHFLAVPYSDATRTDVEGYLDQRPRAPKTNNNMLGHLHAFYSWGAARGLFDSDPREQMLRVVHGKGEHQRLLPPHAAFDPATTRPAIKALSFESTC